MYKKVMVHVAWAKQKVQAEGDNTARKCSPQSVKKAHKVEIEH